MQINMIDIGKIIPPKSTYIDGRWVKSSKIFSVYNPATNESISEVPDMDEQQVLQIANKADECFHNWKSQSDRNLFLYTWYLLIKENYHTIAQLLTTEQGKNITSAEREVLSAAEFIPWYIAESERLYGENIPNRVKNNIHITQIIPTGTTLAITPWNYPVAMILRKCTASLAAGCPVLLKPSEETPLTALYLAELADQAGIGNAFSVITTRSNLQQVSKVLLASKKIKNVSFTGSVETGHLVYQAASMTMKKTVLELGGNSPFIVFSDADIENALNHAIFLKFLNAGQVCITANRFLIQEDIYNDFVSEFKHRVKNLSIGPGIDNHDIGPVINFDSVRKISTLVDTANKEGAHIEEMGIDRTNQQGSFKMPIIITKAHNDMEICQEEIFGPVAVFLKFKNEQEAFAIANDTNYGLASYCFSQNYGTIMRFRENLETGMMFINSCALPNPKTPFGGMKGSGIGQEGGENMLENYCLRQSIQMFY
ncbi:MAG: succinate-semialdehyde dehydrogenase [NADP+] [Candidatus Xenolissoclinum pacificiensis L6]|uniref:Succinate-semialdehyde dehydrogenase [NADP+] n=1 Tax=Candidatus Xenolissoclinum pacificiensis L6 TaxID=1401685 RepID=W2UZX8_9RICK|nr:MAG: succinate-semialdehyde dehydrogenase [NADP+] [Candidatus Xenolissoclinum pacificiensis L6]